MSGGRKETLRCARCGEPIGVRRWHTWGGIHGDDHEDSAGTEQGDSYGGEGPDGEEYCFHCLDRVEAEAAVVEEGR